MRLRLKLKQVIIIIILIIIHNYCNHLSLLEAPHKWNETWGGLFYKGINNFNTNTNNDNK